MRLQHAQSGRVALAVTRRGRAQPDARPGPPAGAPDSITFSGNGEPTLHPRFAVVVDRVLAVRAEVALKTRVAILSNGLSAGDQAVRAALMRLDDRIMKLDPADGAGERHSL